MNYNDEAKGKKALQLRALAAAGETWVPRIYTAGMWGPKQYLGLGDTQPVVLDSVATYVAAYKAAGYDFIKVHNETPAVLDSVLAAAKRIGIPVAGHVPPPVRVEHVLPLGYKSIEHPFVPEYLWNKRMDEESTDTAGIVALARAVRRAGVWHCPTQQHYDRLHLDPPKLLKVEQDAGVKLLLGTDEFPWLGVITAELQSMVYSGLTPYQALLTGTRNVAEYFGTLAQSGTITAGKRADMVLLSGNPLQDVRYTAQPSGVMLGGRWLAREEIDRRIDTLKLATYAPGYEQVEILPLKSYWHNVADHAMDIAVHVLESATIFKLDTSAVALTDTQEKKHEALKTAHRKQLEALSDSLGRSDQYASGTQRLFRLIGQQLGEDRLDLTPEQRVKFDRKASAWIQRRKKEGYSVTVPGLQHGG